MRRFVFYRDSMFWIGCSVYLANRWWLKPHLPWLFLRSHLNDMWLVPCALPLVLWVHERCGWRAPGAPRFGEIAAHLIGWSVLFEWMGPRYLPWATGDVGDIAWYAVGAVLAWTWWRHDLARTPRVAA